MPISNLNSFTTSDTNIEPPVADEIEEGYRVRVCLQRYFSDERSRAYIHVVRLHPVRWLQQRLRTLFGLRGEFCLCSRGHLLPSDEPLSLLQPNDPVEVIPLANKPSECEENNKTNRTASSQVVIESNVFPSVPSKSPATTTITHEAERDNTLICMKQKALELLETYDRHTTRVELDSGAVASGAADGDKPRRTRRRARRRKRHLSVGEQHDCEMGSVVHTIDEVQLQDTTCPAEEEWASSAEIVDVGITVDTRRAEERDGSVDSRKARLVHSLSPQT